MGADLTVPVWPNLTESRKPSKTTLAATLSSHSGMHSRPEEYGQTWTSAMQTVSHTTPGSLESDTVCHVLLVLLLTCTLCGCCQQFCSGQAHPSTWSRGEPLSARRNDHRRATLRPLSLDTGICSAEVWSSRCPTAWDAHKYRHRQIGTRPMSLYRHYLVLGHSSPGINHHAR